MQVIGCGRVYNNTHRSNLIHSLQGQPTIPFVPSLGGLKGLPSLQTSGSSGYRCDTGHSSAFRCSTHAQTSTHTWLILPPVIPGQTYLPYLWKCTNFQRSPVFYHHFSLCCKADVTVAISVTYITHDWFMSTSHYKTWYVWYSIHMEAMKH